MESINTINKTLFGAALAVLALAMAIPQGTALAKSGMIVRTADLCLVSTELDEYDLGGIGTVAAVTDSRTRLGGGNWTPGTAWAVSLEGMLAGTQYYLYDVYDTGFDCDEHQDNYRVYSISTDGDGIAFENSGGSVWTINPDVDDVIQICRCDPGTTCRPAMDVGDVAVLTRILEGVLVKGGKERNKPNRC